MTRMKGYGDLEELSYTQLRRGAQYYEVFHFEGSFCHESKHSSSTPKLMEVLGGIGDSDPERVMVLCRSEDTGETFKAFVEMKIVSLEEHCYQSPDRESVKRNTKDAKKNKKFLGHLPVKQVSPPQKLATKSSAPENEWA